MSKPASIILSEQGETVPYAQAAFELGCSTEALKMRLLALRRQGIYTISVAQLRKLAEGKRSAKRSLYELLDDPAARKRMLKRWEKNWHKLDPYRQGVYLQLTAKNINPNTDDGTDGYD